MNLLMKKLKQAIILHGSERDTKHILVRLIRYLSKFAIRYYRAKKLIYSAVQMLMEAKTSRNNECIVAYYFLAYYALFQAMQANLIICKAFDDEKVLQLSHDNIKKLFDAQFCQNNKCPIDSEIITLIEELRKNREYFLMQCHLILPKML